MKVQLGGRAFLVAAVASAVAVVMMGFLIALGVRSVVAEPGAGPSGPVPTPVGHAWTELQGHGVDASGVYMSTQDGEALELRVNNARALRLEPNATSPNVIGGYSGNGVTAGAVGATISGGGSAGFSNRVTDNVCAVGGGMGNQAGNGDGDPVNAGAATVAGGIWNTASGSAATVGGGDGNRASASYATVGGGYANNANGEGSTVGGGESNQAEALFATIGGGGRTDDLDPATANYVTDDFGTVGGGGDNLAGDAAGTTYDRPFATVGGGYSNEASGYAATIGGGYASTASASYATIAGGGRSNPVDAASGNLVTDNYGAVGGGGNNQAGDNAGTRFDRSYATVAGGEGNTASGSYSAIGGGDTNTASDNYSTIGGGYSNFVTDDSGTVGGGGSNQAGDPGTTGGNEEPYATVGGGIGNTAASGRATIGGGERNEASGPYATIGGGYDNTASASYATIAGGGRSDPMTAGTANLVTDNYGTVGGGGNNRAGDNAGSTADRIYATVAGGKSNTASASYATIAGGGESTPGTPATGNRATDNYCTVGGGGNNQAGDGDTDPTTAPYATVGGGNSNTASNDYGTVAGGEGNTASGSYSAIGGGDTNTASGSRATVGGGLGNIASGSYATVPGGYQNAAAALYSFAAGYRAKANHSGAFVWGDLTANDVASTGNNQFIVRASGGIWFGTTSSPSIPAGDFLNTSTGGHLTTGGQWTNASDREMKENFTRVDGQAVLASLAEIPITTWNSKAEDASIRHMGPVAQDFYAAFGLGTSDTSIGTLDADGVALAAIQGLYQLSQEQAERIQALERENVELRQRLGDLETRVTALEGGAPVSGDSAGLLSGLSAGWLALGGLAVVAGLVLVQRRRPGGRP